MLCVDSSAICSDEIMGCAPEAAGLACAQKRRPHTRLPSSAGIYLPTRACFFSPEALEKEGLARGGGITSGRRPRFGCVEKPVAAQRGAFALRGGRALALGACSRGACCGVPGRLSLCWGGPALLHLLLPGHSCKAATGSLCGTVPSSAWGGDSDDGLPGLLGSQSPPRGQSGGAGPLCHWLSCIRLRGTRQLSCRLVFAFCMRQGWHEEPVPFPPAWRPPATQENCVAEPGRPEG